jgi:hypothetical protein
MAGTLAAGHPLNNALIMLPTKGFVKRTGRSFRPRKQPVFAANRARLIYRPKGRAGSPSLDGETPNADARSEETLGFGIKNRSKYFFPAFFLSLSPGSCEIAEVRIWQGVASTESRLRGNRPRKNRTQRSIPKSFADNALDRKRTAFI